MVVVAGVVALVVLGRAVLRVADAPAVPTVAALLACSPFTVVPVGAAILLDPAAQTHIILS